MANKDFRQRRQLIRLGALGTASLASPWSLGSAAAKLSSPDTWQTTVAASLASARFQVPETASRIGAAYLQSTPSEASPDSILRGLLSDVPNLADIVAGHEEARLSVALERAIRSDFEQGEVVNIEGWILARTEARLAALALFTRQ